jgi:hypothetical protein
MFNLVLKNCIAINIKVTEDISVTKISSIIVYFWSKIKEEDRTHT